MNAGRLRLAALLALAALAAAAYLWLAPGGNGGPRAGNLADLPHRLPIYEPRDLPAEAEGTAVDEHRPADPRPEDLGRGDPVQLTRDVLTVGAQLRGEPQRLFELVRDHVVYEPYYGARKGSFETSLAGAGNDVDQAALLVALLRAAEIPARFVRGIIEISTAEAQSWLRVEGDRALRRILERTGLPHRWLGERLQVEHFWVAARIDGRWRSFDPSFKQHRRIPGIDLGEVGGIGGAELAAALELSGAEPDAAAPVPSVDGRKLEALVDDAAARLGAYLAARPELEWQGLFGGDEIIPRREAAETSYRVVRVLGEYGRLPPELQYRVTLRLGGLEHSDTTANLNRRRTTLHFLRRGELLSPRLLVSKKEVARGSPVAAGSVHRLEVELAIPGQRSEAVTKEIRAGGYYALGFDLGRIPDREIFFRADIARRIRREYEEGVLNVDNLFGELLFALAKSYFYRLDKRNDQTARAAGILWLRQPSLVVAGLEVEDGEPLVTLDLLRDVLLPVAADGDGEKEKDFMLASGLDSSALEAAVIEDLTGEAAVSAGSLLELARQRGIPLWIADAESWPRVERRLQRSPQQLRQIAESIERGWTVLVAERGAVQRGAVPGPAGYAILDPETLSADFRLAALSGGVGAVHELIETLIDLPNPVDNLKKILEADDVTQALSGAAAAAGQEIPAVALVGQALDVYDQAFQRLSLFGAIGGYYTGKIQAPPIAPILGDDVERLKREVLKKVVTDYITKHLSLATSFGPQLSGAPHGKVVISIAYGLAFDIMSQHLEKKIESLIDEAFKNNPQALPWLDKLVGRMLEAGLALRLSELYQRFVVMPSLFGTPGIIF